MASSQLSPDHPDGYTPDPRRWRVLAVLTVALFMSLIDVSIVNVALPTIQSGLGATEAELQWVLSGYALTFGVGLVAAGRAGDIYGRSPLFILGVVLFTASSITSGLAVDATMLNIARAVQGIGSGMISPQAVGMIQQYFRGDERGRAFGIFGATVGVSVAIGPLLGGLLIAAGGPEHGWRWTFFVNGPVGVAAVVLALVWFPRPMFNRDAGSASLASLNRNLDPLGAALLGFAVLGLLLPFVESGKTWWAWAGLPVGLLLIAAWVRWERAHKRRGHNPMVDLDIFKVASFASGTLLITIYFTGMTSIWVLVALYMQDGLGHTALESGLVGLPSSILSILAALWAGRSVARIGRTVVILGLYFVLAGLALSIVVVWGHSSGLLSEWWLLLSLALVGAGGGAVVSPNQALTLSDVPLDYAGSSGGIMQTGQRIGTSVGIAMITALAFLVLGISNWSIAFIVGLIGVMLIITVSLIVGYRDRSARRREGRVGLAGRAG